MTIRYAAAACQTDLPNPLDRRQMAANTDRMLSMIDAAVAGSAPFLPVRLVVFPEFAHAAPVYRDRRGTHRSPRRAGPERAHRPAGKKASEHGIYIQSGSMIELDPRWPHVVFNTTCLIGPEGILSRVPQGEHVDSVRSPRKPARPRRLRRTAVSRGRHGHRPARMRDLLRLVVSGSAAAAVRQRRRGPDSRVRVHGPVGRDRANELVDAGEPRPRAREHRVRRGCQSGGQPAALSAVLVARRQSDRRLRRSSCSRRRHPVPASGSSSRPSTSARCGTNGRRGWAITCSRTCEPKPIRCIAQHRYPPAGHQTAAASYERNVELIRQVKNGVEANHGTDVPARR